MKLVKTASGKNKIKMSKSEWTSIGKKAGWMKEAETKYIKYNDAPQYRDYERYYACPQCGGKMSDFQEGQGVPIGRDCETCGASVEEPLIAVDVVNKMDAPSPAPAPAPTQQKPQVQPRAYNNPPTN